MNLHVLISIFRRKWFFLNGRQKHSGCHFSIPHLLTFSPAASKRKCTVFNGESFRRAVVGVRTRTHQGMGDRPIDGHGLNEGGLITRDRKSGSSRCCRRLGRRTSICRFYKYLGSVFMTFTSIWKQFYNRTKQIFQKWTFSDSLLKYQSKQKLREKNISHRCPAECPDTNIILVSDWWFCKKKIFLAKDIIKDFI